MFAILQRNIMEPTPASRLSPPNLSPPPGLLPTLPIASTPTSLSTAAIKQEVQNPLLEQEQQDGEPTFKPLPTIESIKLERKELDSDGGFNPKIASSDSRLLKQRLEMYWQGMMKYQEQLQRQDENVVPDAKVKVEEDDSKPSEAVNHVKMEVQPSPDVLEKAKNVVQKLIEDDNKTLAKDYQMPWPSLATIAASRQLRSPKNGQSNHISNIVLNRTNDASLQQASILSQQAIAAMLSLHNMQQQQSLGSVDLGNLLPPPPALLRPEAIQGTRSKSGDDATSQSTSANIPPLISTVGHYRSTTSFQSSGSPLNLSQHSETAVRSSHTPTSESSIDADKRYADVNSDLPLDLSLPASSRKRARDSPPKIVPKPPHPSSKVSRLPPPLLCINQGKNKIKDLQSLANIQSNFPSILNKSDNRSVQHAALEEHIKNGLSNKPVPTSSGPFMSLYQNQDSSGSMFQAALAAAGGKTLNELVQSGVPPVQIQQWLLAAMSAQKAQQMALNHFSLMQQQASKQTDPPKKRQKMSNDAQIHHLSMAHQSPQGIMHQQQNNGMFQQLPNSPAVNTPTSTYAKSRTNTTPASNRSPKSRTSPTLSPNSTQSQSGKRYRRYAKPPYSYVSLITLSILSSREKKLRLSQILKRISEMFPFFNGSYQGWRDSVRHNLSQNECFVKVLKNPYRPTAKGNFWTVNLNSIPHELLLRQNTLVSRYAQDSGYRYRKDLSEVFDLRSGALKVPVPRHLFREAGDIQSSVLADDPAAVMEAILLEETNEDEMSDYKDKIPPEIKRFTLEDLFNQNEETEDDSLLSGGRGRGRSKQASLPAQSQASPVLSRSFAPPMYQSKNPFFASHQSPTMVDNFQASLHNRAIEAQSLAMRMVPGQMLPPKSTQSDPLSLPLTNANAPNPFAAAQTALLSKALASQLQGLGTFPNFQKMLYANQMAQNHRYDDQTENRNSATPAKTPSPPPTDIQHVSPIARRNTPSPIGQQVETLSVQSDPPSALKRNKRKGIQPVRHAGHDEEVSMPQDDESTDMSTMSPHRSSFSIPVTASSSTPSRTLSSEVDSATTASNPFCSPVMSSSSSKSHTSVSPHRDDSSEFEEHHHPSQSLFGLEGRDSAQATGLSGFQSLQIFGTQSLQASKMS